MLRRRPRHYKAKRGSDEGGKPINGAALRLDFEVTAGFCVLILPPSIDKNESIYPWPLRVLVAPSVFGSCDAQRL